MPLVPRNVLKSFFQTGDKPTQAQFDCLIDSLLHYAEDRDKLGLKNYNPLFTYLTGDTVVFEEDIYMANATTTGGFDPDYWNKISPALKFNWEQETPDSTDTKLKITFNKDFKPLVAGTYTVQWYCELGRDSSVVVTNKTRILLNNIMIGESAVRITDDKEYVGFGGFFSANLSATLQNLKVDFLRLSGSSGDVLIRHIRIRVIKD